MSTLIERKFLLEKHDSVNKWYHSLDVCIYLNLWAPRAIALLAILVPESCYIVHWNKFSNRPSYFVIMFREISKRHCCFIHISFGCILIHTLTFTVYIKANMKQCSDNVDMLTKVSNHLCETNI